MLYKRQNAHIEMINFFHKILFFLKYFNSFIKAKDKIINLFASLLQNSTEKFK